MFANAEFPKGTFELTGRPMDLAINGEGLFQVRMPDDTIAYTRDGSFTISDQGVIVTAGGYPVVPDLQLTPDMTDVAISRTGIVTGSVYGETQPVELGRIELARFANEPGLEALGENLWGETAASGEPILGAPQEDGFGRIAQGALESSNVNAVDAMVRMMEYARHYETQIKMMNLS